MEALIENASKILQEQMGNSSCDSAIIAASQLIEHFEIASYATLIAWADEMGQTEALGLLEDTLIEEKDADEKLALIEENLGNKA